jgi:hypothetical protein
MPSETPKLDAFTAGLRRSNLATYQALRATPVEEPAARYATLLAWNDFLRAQLGANERAGR